MIHLCGARKTSAIERLVTRLVGGKQMEIAAKKAASEARKQEKLKRELARDSIGKLQK